MSTPPLSFHEFVVAPAAFAAAFLHARRALGGGRAAGELLALAAYGYALEAVAIRVFASHDYGPGWAVAPLGVPVAVALVWAAVISSAMALAARNGPRGIAARAAVAALIAISLDLLIEPVAVRAGLWRWTPPGPWLGVPIGNFVGWAVIVAGYAYGAERFSGEAGAAGVLHAALRRLAVAAASVLALVVVGLAWRESHAEGLFSEGRGWIAWASILAITLVATAARGFRPEGAGLGARLGRAPGWGPAAVFLGLAAVFAADAAALADPLIGLVAVASAAVLVRVSGRASSGSSAPSRAGTEAPAPRAPGGGGG